LVMSSAGLLERVRAICLSFPQVTERPSHSAPTFFVRDKKAFVNAWVDGHHGDTFPHLWCAAPAGMQQAILSREGRRYFRPPYVGARGWIGVRLDVDLDWREIADICEDAYRAVAPPSLSELLEGPPAGPSPGR
jgi:YjbR